MLANHHLPELPTLSGPVLVDGAGLPRYWATVWASFLPADIATSTLRKKLSHIDAFYRYADGSLGFGGLDDALADFDVNLLCDALEGYFLSIRNQAPVTAASEERWQAAVQFVTEIAQRLTRNLLNPARHDALNGRLMRLELLNSHLHVSSRRRPERIRSLPSEVVEGLYEMLDPGSPTNPFRGAASRWRVYIIFMLLLHQGLRRGELLSFPVDVIKTGFDQNIQQLRLWMSVRYNEYEDEDNDPRYSKPSIKNAPSIRQIPVSRPTSLLVEEYVMNYRGKTNHSFLVNSQKGTPFSTEGITKIFRKITASLPKHLRICLHNHTGKDSISPHDLRHTCAVVRLNQLLSAGVEMTDALERLRVFFGWSRDSEMPLRYARAVFEDRLASVWNSKFDERVEVLRNLPARLK